MQRSGLLLSYLALRTVAAAGPVEHWDRRRGGHHEDLIALVGDRPGHDRRYAADPGRALVDLGWQAEEPFDQGLDETVGWVLDGTGETTPAAQRQGRS